LLDQLDTHLQFALKVEGGIPIDSMERIEDIVPNYYEVRGKIAGALTVRVAPMLLAVHHGLMCGAGSARPAQALRVAAAVSLGRRRHVPQHHPHQPPAGTRRAGCDCAAADGVTQPVSIVTDSTCASCDFNRPEHNWYCEQARVELDSSNLFDVSVASA
jgi:hypothetical protein